MPFLLVLTAFFGFQQSLLAQTTTITTEAGTGYDAINEENGRSAVTFVIQNTNTYDITVTGIDMYWASKFSGTVPTLWYTATSLSGAPTIAPTGWTAIATGPAVSMTTAGYYPALTNLSFNIPANTQYRFALESSLGLNYSGLAISLGSAPPPAPSVFTVGGVTLKLYDEKINTLNVGYAGSFPAPLVTPAAFTGRVHFMPTAPCTAPPVAGQAVSSVATACPNTNFVLSLSGSGPAMGMTYQWQASANGTTGWTNITGATTPYFNVSQTTTTHYRAQLTCSGQTTSSASVQVTTTATPVTGTYTINKGLPTSATNFTSFADAIDFIQCGGLSGPVIFNVVTGSGPYTEQVVVPIIPGASATNTVTFNGNGNSLVNPATTGNVLTLDGADFIRFNNLTIEAAPTATTGAVVILTNAANDNIFSGCNLVHSTATTTTSYGVSLTGRSSDNTFQNNTITGAYYGISNYGGSGASNNGNQFIGNTLKDQHFYGIYNAYATNSLISSNDISRPTRTNGNAMYGIYAATGSTSLTISKNRVHNTHDAATTTNGAVYGIYTAVAGTSGNENMISNNAIYNINNSGGSLFGIYNSGGNNTYYYHNTISADMPGISYSALRGIYFLSASTNVRFRNNNISLGSDATTKYAIYLNQAAIALQTNNNNLHIGSAGNIGYAASDKTSLADWQAVNSNAFDQNSVAANPMYADLANGNLRPTNSTLNDIGTAIAVSDDITGATRSTTTPDPGAWEFSLIANDAEAMALVSPLTPVPPSVSQPVQVTFKNNGSNAITSVVLTVTITGAATQTFTHNWTGNLASNQTSAPVTVGNFTFPAGSFVANVCTSLPNGVADANPANDCLNINLISCLPLTGNYTIDQGNPASATNFVSLSDAAQRLSSCGVSGPVTFSVASGSGPYNEQMLLKAIGGVSATNTVTFEGNGNTIATTPGSLLGIVSLDGAEYVRINNFNITLDAAATAGWGVQLMNNANNNTISNNTITLPLTATVADVSGIVTGVHTIAPGSHTNNSKIENNTIIGGYFGIRINGNADGTGASNNDITGNTLKDSYMQNIYLNNTDGTLVQGNDISRPDRTTVTTFYGIYMAGLNKNTEISKNRIHNTHGSATSLTGAAYGIYTVSSDAPVGSENVVKNNLIYNIGSTGTVYGIYSAGSDGIHYFHNSINLDNTASTGTVRGFYQLTSALNVKFQNNTVSINGGTSGSKHALYFGTTASSIASDHNVLFAANGANIGSWGTTNQPTLADWRLASLQDANSVSADPQYLNLGTGNLRPTNVAVNDIGMPIATVTDDITGAPRSTTTPDPGAYEFSINPIDLGVTAISGAASGCGLTSAQTITITVKNFGSATQSNIPVNFLVGSTIIGTGIVPGPLAPNKDTTYTFTTPANLGAPGQYTIVANTLMTGDTDPSNDSFTLSVTNSLIPTLPVSLDFENPATGMGSLQVVTNANSGIQEHSGAAFTGTKGLVMDGIDHAAWVSPTGVNDPWQVNPDHFSAVYMCIDPSTIPANYLLHLTFNLKQLFKTANVNTNFRVTVNGVQVGPNYRPPFDPSNPATPIAWQNILVDLTAYKSATSLQIGLESSVKEGFANGNGPANLIDNLKLAAIGMGLKDNVLQSQISVFPNPSAGIFNVTAPQGKYTIEVVDMTGRTILKQNANGTSAQLNLSEAAKGIYLMKITSEGSIATKRLVVE